MQQRTGNHPSLPKIGHTSQIFLVVNRSLQLNKPGGWSPYTFWAKFTVLGKKVPPPITRCPLVNRLYQRTHLVTEVNGWNFFYKGWRHHLDNGDFWRKDASRNNIFPPNRKSRLDRELLTGIQLMAQIRATF